MHLRAVLSLGNFFCAAQYALVLYIVAPYLATFIPESYVGFVIALGALGALLIFPFVPRLVRSIGSRRLAIVSIGLSLASLLGLAAQPSPLLAILLMSVFGAVQPVIGYLLDLMLETTVTSECDTGRVRTAFITCANLAFVLAPLAVAFLLGPADRYQVIFLAAAGSLVPAVLLLAGSRIKDESPPSFANMREVYRCLVRDPDFFSIGIAYGTLQFFYNLAPFFIPLYLHTVLGFPWSELGWMFAVALIPFVVLEYPVGWLADRLWGDRELMAMGFLLTGAAFAAMAFVTAATPALTLLIVLLLSRIGAAMAEATSESHFFRRVSEKDPNSVGVFRMLRPMGALAAPVAGSLFLLWSTYDIFFFVSGIAIIIVGVGSALSIRDVR